MHFALPPRKTSQPPPYVKAAARSLQNRRRSQAQAITLIVLGLLSLWLLLHLTVFGAPSWRSQAVDTSNEEEINIVILTVLDRTLMSDEYIRKVKHNRDDYASRHGYTNFYAEQSTYTELVHPAPRSWSLVPALRHTLAAYPTASHVFALTPHAVITNSSLSLEAHILESNVLASLMIKDSPVVPPDSVIHTFSHLTPAQTDLILTQDIGNLAHHALILRNSAWSRFFLDVWLDPLYRAYNFQKAEQHALEHIIQWHPTILAKLVLIEQRRLNSYSFAEEPEKDSATGTMRYVDTKWQPGDLLVNFERCDEYSDERDCEKEFTEYYDRWLEEIEVDIGDSEPMQELNY